MTNKPESFDEFVNKFLKEIAQAMQLPYYLLINDTKIPIHHFNIPSYGFIFICMN
jgi:hypothetical protein